MRRKTSVGLGRVGNVCPTFMDEKILREGLRWLVPLVGRRLGADLGPRKRETLNKEQIKDMTDSYVIPPPSRM